MRAKPLVVRGGAMSREDYDRIFSSWQWQEVRAIAIALCNRACVFCGSQHRLEVDHVEPMSSAPADARPFDPAGLQALCHGCHQEKTTSLDANPQTRFGGHDPRRDKRSEQTREFLQTVGRDAAQRAGVNWRMTAAEWVGRKAPREEISV